MKIFTDLHSLATSFIHLVGAIDDFQYVALIFLHSHSMLEFMEMEYIVEKRGKVLNCYTSQIHETGMIFESWKRSALLFKMLYLSANFVNGQATINPLLYIQTNNCKLVFSFSFVSPRNQLICYPLKICFNLQFNFYSFFLPLETEIKLLDKIKDLKDMF